MTDLLETINLLMHDVLESGLDEGFFDDIPGGVVTQGGDDDHHILSADGRLFKLTLTEITDPDEFNATVEENNIPLPLPRESLND
jgi:hypothetical protein